MKLEELKSEHAPKAIGPYSHGRKYGNMIITSGQIPLDPDSGAVVGADITAQTQQVLHNIGALLEAAGTGYDKVVKTSCFLADMGDFPVFNQLYAQKFVSNPARSCVAVKTLPKGVLVEIEVIAELP